MTDDSRPEFTLWVATLDPRTRPEHGRFPPVIDWPADPPPPVHLGMFNCSGDYVWPGTPPVTLLSQSGGQIIDALTPMRERIAGASHVSEDLLTLTPKAYRALIDRRTRILLRRIDEALLTELGFPTRAYPAAQPQRLSKRRARRLRGREKTLRRWQ